MRNIFFVGQRARLVYKAFAVCVLALATNVAVCDAEDASTRDASQNASKSALEKTASLFKRVELSAAATVEQEKATPRAQVKMLFRDAEVRVNSNFGAINYAEPSLEKMAITPGALFSTAKFLPFDLTVKAGMLSATGLYSRLSSPSPSAPSGVFSARAKAAKALDVRLPSTTSSKKDWNGSAHFAWSQKDKIFSNVAADFFVQQGGLFAGSAAVAFAPTKKSEIGAVVSFGRFYFGKNSSGWFLDANDFYDDWFYEGVGSLYFKNKFVSSVFTVTAHEATKTRSVVVTERDTGNKINMTFHNKTTLQYGPIILNVAGFYGGREIFYVGNGNKETCEAQFSLNPQFRFVVISKVPMHVNFGVAAFAQIDKGDGDISERFLQKYILGASLSSAVFRASANLSAAFSAKQSYEVKASAALMRFRFKPSLTVANTISVPAANASEQAVAAKQVVTIGAYGTPANFNGRITGSLSTTLTEKFPATGDAFFDAATFSASLDVLWRAKYLQVNGKITAKVGN